MQSINMRQNRSRTNISSAAKAARSSTLMRTCEIYAAKYARNGFWNLPALKPGSLFVMRWQTVMVVAMIAVALFVPYDTAFLVPSLVWYEGVIVFIMNRLLDILFLLDMAVTMNTCIPDPKTRGATFISNRSKIIHAYLCGWFTPDLLSCFPYDAFELILPKSWFSSLKVVKVLRLIRLGKLLRILRANRLLIHLETNYEIDYASLQFSGFMVMLFCLTHWLGCIWYMILMIEENKECNLYRPVGYHPDDEWQCCYNWLDCADSKLNFNDENSLRRKYMLSIVWASGQVFTTGSNLDAVTKMEAMYQLAAQTICGIAYAYLLGAMCNIFAAKARSKTQFYERVDMLNTYLRNQSINRNNHELCVRLRTYFRYSHIARDKMSSIMESISPHLRGLLAFQVHSNWFLQLRIFRECKMPNDFFSTLALTMTAHVFAPGETVLDSHSLSDCIYIVQSGIVMTKGIRLVIAGKVVGDEALAVFRENQTRGYQATSMTHGKLYHVPTADMLDIMHRAKYKRLLRAAFVYMGQLRCVNLLKYFAMKVHQAVKTSHSFLEACEILVTELDFLRPASLVGSMGIMARSYLNIHHGIMGCTLSQLDDILIQQEKFPEDLWQYIIQAMADLERNQNNWKSNSFSMKKSNPATPKMERSVTTVFKEYAASLPKNAIGLSPNIGPFDSFKRRSQHNGSLKSPQLDPDTPLLLSPITMMSIREMYGPKLDPPKNVRISNSTLPEPFTSADDELQEEEALQTMAKNLEVWGLEAMAEFLVKDHALTWEMLQTMTAEQMSIVRIPMGKALRMVSFFSAHHKS